MPVYERVQDGRVAERVAPLDGDYEDTRLGLLALEGQNGWRIAGQAERPPEPPAGDKPAQQPPADEPTEQPDAEQPTSAPPPPARRSRQKE